MRIQPRRQAATQRVVRPSARSTAGPRRLRHRRWLAALAVGLFAPQVTGAGPVSAAPGDPAAPAAGPRTATLTINDNAPASPHTAALTGTGGLPCPRIGSE